MKQKFCQKCLSWVLILLFFFLRLFFKAVLGLQQNGQEGTEIPHDPPPSHTCIAIIKSGSFFLFSFKFINLFIYLFIFGCVGSSFLCEGFLQLRWAGATLHCGARASHRRGLSVAEHRLQTRKLSSRGSGLSCPAACGIFPDQGSNPCPLHWQADSQPLRHQGSPFFLL